MDFKQLASELLARSESLCEEWLPSGKKQGKEYVVGSLSGDKGKSLKVNLNTGVWKDFATGDSGGDFIDLYAAIHRIDNGEAYRQLTIGHEPEAMKRPAKKPVRAQPDIRQIFPVPTDAPETRCIHSIYGEPVQVWDYRNANRELLGHVARYHDQDGKKQIVPWTFSDRGWVMKQFPEPRPLYGLETITPDIPILIVEGEKSADAARQIVGPRYAVVTWPGGSQAWKKADFTPVHGHKILLWPDADEPGVSCMSAIAATLSSPQIKILDVSDHSDGWDAADSGFDWPAFLEWAKKRAFVYTSPEESDNPPEDIPPPPEFSETDPFNHGPAIDVFKEAPVPAITADMLPAEIAAYAFDQGELIGVSPSMIAMPAIVACAAVIHDGIEIQPKRHETGWRESARLWCAVVGAPSVRKSPSLKRAVSRLKKINKDLCEQNDKLMADYQSDLEVWKETNKQEKKSGTVVTKKPDEPAKSRLIVEDITVEALSEILKHNERGVLCVHDELTGWFGSMDAYSGGKAANKDRAHWLESYNGGHRMIDRIGRGNISVPNWSACMVGGIQPDMIRKIAQSMGEDGLMQRFMIIIGENTRGEQDRPEDTDAKRGYQSMIDSLYAIQPSHDPVTLSEDAHVIREEITAYANELTTYQSLPGGLKSHLGKWSGLFSRLLLTYHVIECVSLRRHPVSVPVAGSTARKVDTLMRRFLLPHALSYYTDILGGVSDLEHIRWIAGHILSKRIDVLESRQLMQDYRAWRGVNEWGRARIMVSMEELGWLSPVGDNRPGRKMPNAWVVNPVVHEQFLTQAEHEKERRKTMREHLLNLSNNVNK